MDLGIITSYIIAGMIFLAITMMTLSLSQSTTELTLNQNARQNVQTVAEMLDYDIPKVAYQQKIRIENEAIEVADDHKITFKSDIDNDGSINTVTWEFTDQEITQTGNPNDYKLLRIQDEGTASEDITEVNLGITKFNIRYYDGFGLTESNAMSTPVDYLDRENIKQIEIEVEAESPEAVANRGGSDRYLRSAWEKRFSPGNLE